MNKSQLFYLLFFALTITSCVSTKDITMFQDSDLDQKQFYIPSTEEHRIKPFDNLYLSVLTLDSEVNSIFNPSLAGNGLTTGTQYMYGTPSSQYINGYRVSAKGTITLPILGELVFAGLSLVEAESMFKERAEEYLKEPTVQVKLLNYKINIIGEIRNPGVYYNYEGRINIIDAISMANGITDYADIKNVVVKRQNENRIRTHIVNLTDNSIYSSEVFYLQPNDLVYLPPSELKRTRENRDAYAKVLSTISTLLVAITLFLNL